MKSILLAIVLFSSSSAFAAAAKVCTFNVENSELVIEYVQAGAKFGSYAHVQYRGSYSPVQVTMNEIFGVSYGPYCDQEFCLTGSVIKLNGPTTHVQIIDNLKTLEITGVVNAESISRGQGACR